MKTLFKRITTSAAGFDTLPVRVAAGAIFAAHGAQKLFGWFGGYGLEGAEFFGGLALILGLLVRPAAAVLAVTMVVAIVTVHLSNGLFMANNGYEFGLALLAVIITLVIRGAGSVSVDQLISTKLSQ